MTFAVMLSPVIITAENAAIRLLEGAGPAVTATLASDTYYLRGDGAADDLCLAIKTALEAAGAGTYTITVQFDTDPDNKSAIVSISATGVATFQLQFASGSTTFPEAVIGFANASTANDGNPKVNTLSPSSVWVTNDQIAEFEPFSENPAELHVTPGGRTRITMFGNEKQLRRLGLQFIADKRSHSAWNPNDPTSGLDKFITRSASGLPFELHLEDISSGTILSALNSADPTTFVGDFVFDPDSIAQYEPQRIHNAIGLYDWAAILRYYT